MENEKRTVKIEKLDGFTDDRGVVFNPIEISTLINQKNMHVVSSVPGAIRGNHYHPKGTETLVILGPARVRVREQNALRDIDIPDRSVYRLTIPPGISHAVTHTGTEKGILVSFSTIAYDPADPDVVQDLLF